MLLKTKGIVFRAIKHKETSLILHIYTLEKGIRSFIINGVRKPKSKIGASLFQVGTILNLELYFHENKDINRIKEAKPFIIYKEIPFNAIRGGTLLFLVEVMNKCIWESEKNEPLYSFLESSLINLDNNSSYLGTIPLSFVVNLSRYLGIFPNFKEINKGEGFDMVELVPAKESLKVDTIFSYDMCQRINYFQLNNTWEIDMGKIERTQLFERWLTYYKIHVHSFQTPKSYEIMKEIFS